MQENFRALILTYKTTPVEIREQVAVDQDQTKRLLQLAKKYTGVTDMLVISTCNRTEMYYSAAQDMTAELIDSLKIVKNISSDLDLKEHFVSLQQQEAIQHLFEVAVGLDSQIIGDTQISGQVKKAYQWSMDENVVGSFLHRLMDTVFACNKQIVRETHLQNGAASMAYATKELVEDLTATMVSPKILIVGSGQIGKNVVRNLADSKLKDVTIFNRTFAKSTELAKETGFFTEAIEELPTAIKTADIVVSSVAGDQPIITREVVGVPESGRHVFFIDLSMPRSIDPAVGEVAGVIVYNLDDIQEKTDSALEERKASIPRAQAIIAESLSVFTEWLQSRTVSPTIKKLKDTLEQMRQDEVAHFSQNVDPKEAVRLQKMSRVLIQRVLHYPILQLKAASKRGDAATLAQSLSELFELEEKSSKKL